MTQINKIAHSKKVFAQLKNFNKDYSNFDIFIDDFENFLVEKIKLPSKDLSSQDKIFEGIILRLDSLLEYKNLVIKIYLESQKNPKYFQKISQKISQDFENIQFPTSHKGAENPFKLISIVICTLQKYKN